MKVAKKLLMIVSLLAAALALSNKAAAQLAPLLSGEASVFLELTIPESLTLSTAPTGILQCPLDASGIATCPTITVTTMWTLDSSRNSVEISAYFSSSAALTRVGGGGAIANTSIFGSVNGGAFTAFTDATAFSPFGRFILSPVGQPPIPGGNTGVTRNDDLDVKIVPSDLPGIYTGTLFVQAQAI